MSTGKHYRLSEVAKHSSQDDCWIIISNKVYDVTKFLHEHPGGEEVLMDFAGRDATSGFEDVGHSSDAREMLTNYLLGGVHEEDRAKSKMCAWSAASSSVTTLGMIVPVVSVILLGVLYRYFGQ